MLVHDSLLIEVCVFGCVIEAPTCSLTMQPYGVLLLRLAKVMRTLSPSVVSNTRFNIQIQIFFSIMDTEQICFKLLFKLYVLKLEYEP